MKAKLSTGPVKTIVYQLKITDLSNHLSQMIFIFYLIQTPTCKLHLVYLATFFAAWTQVNYATKFKDHLKTSLNNNCMGISAKFSKFVMKGEVKLTVALVT